VQREDIDGMVEVYEGPGPQIGFDETEAPLTWAIAVNPEEHCRLRVLMGTLPVSPFLSNDTADLSLEPRSGTDMSRDDSRVWNTRVQLCHPSYICTSSRGKNISNGNIAGISGWSSKVTNEGLTQSLMGQL